MQTLPADHHLVRFLIDGINLDIANLKDSAKISTASISFLQNKSARIDGKIEALMILIGRNAPQIETLNALAACAYFIATKTLQAREAAEVDRAKPTVTVSIPADEVKGMLAAIDTALDDSVHFERDSDEGDTRRSEEQEALGALAGLIDSAAKGAA
jgi:hypothetical protein